jgi:hypothetical protein
MIGSKEYWKGYSDAKSQAERNWQRARIEMNERFINILEDAKAVKGIGPKSHLALVEFGLERMMGESAPAQEQISKKERSRIVKELANTKWSTLSDSQIIAIQNILSIE